MPFEGLKRIHVACELDIKVHRRGLHRKFRLRPRLGMGKLLATFDTTVHQMPTNLLLAHISAPTESAVRYDPFQG